MGYDPSLCCTAACAVNTLLLTLLQLSDGAARYVHVCITRWAQQKLHAPLSPDRAALVVCTAID